jgi:hypothetical protein
VREGADHLLEELDDIDLGSLLKDSAELQELTALVETQAKRLNDEADDGQ